MPDTTMRWDGNCNAPEGALTIPTTLVKTGEFYVGEDDPSHTEGRWEIFAGAVPGVEIVKHIEAQVGYARPCASLVAAAVR